MSNAALCYVRRCDGESAPALARRVGLRSGRRGPAAGRSLATPLHARCARRRRLAARRFLSAGAPHRAGALSRRPEASRRGWCHRSGCPGVECDPGPHGARRSRRTDGVRARERGIRDRRLRRRRDRAGRAHRGARPCGRRRSRLPAARRGAPEARARSHLRASVRTARDPRGGERGRAFPERASRALRGAFRRQARSLSS